MFVKTLKLIGFRNYIEADLKFQAAKTIIIGKNAQGKSNLLEVIQILSHIKSRRATRDAELINFTLGEAILRAEAYGSDKKEINISLQIRKSGRRSLKINDVSKKPSELLHNIYSVSFMVDDLEIINGSPSKRRDWINEVVVQLSNQTENYQEKFSKFENALAQRNSFIKSLNDKNIYRASEIRASQLEELDIWDALYIEAANALTEERTNFINEINPLTRDYYQKISGTDLELELNYLGYKIDAETLRSSLDKDLIRSYTNLGPQRDDVEIKLNNSAAGSFASQGERRSIALSLKLAELELLKLKHNEYPVLLLDDVLAELDEDRQDFLLDSINPETQVIITTTHLGKHLDKWSNNAQILEIENGTVRAFALT